MKKQDFALLSIWVLIPLIIIFNVYLTGCSSRSFKITEEIAEQLIEEDLKGK